MKPITGFKDIDGLDVVIIPSNVFAIRRLTHTDDRRIGTGETVIEIISNAGATLSIVEPKDRFFVKFIEEAFE